MTRLVAVLGSATAPGRLHRALSEALARAAEPGALSTQLIDLGVARIAAADGRPADQLGDDTAETLDAIAAAQAVLLATPVYRGSMTGTLKNLIDHVPTQALRGKPVGIVAMGASDHHYLGAERHLRDVLAFFGVLMCPTACYLSSRDFSDGAVSERAAGELDELIASALSLAGAGVGDLGPEPLGARAR